GAVQVDATARSDEQRVARDQRVADEEALRSGGVPGRVQERDRDITDLDRLARFHGYDVGSRQAGDALHEGYLRLVDVRLGARLLEKLRRAADRMPHQVATKVVGMEV